MIPNKELSRRAYLRDIDALDLPHETIEEFYERIGHGPVDKSDLMNSIMEMDYYFNIEEIQ